MLKSLTLTYTEACKESGYTKEGIFMSNEGKTKMSMGQRVAYSFGAFGNDAFYGLLSGYLIMFITSHLFNSGNQAVDNKMISLVTMIIMVLRIVELFIDPFIGNAIDRTKTRWGHFRPWVVAGGTVSAVLLLCLFTSLGNLYQKNAMLYLVIFAVMYITMDIFYSFFEDFTLKQKSGAEIKAMDDAMELRVKKGEAK